MDRNRMGDIELKQCLCSGEESLGVEDSRRSYTKGDSVARDACMRHPGKGSSHHLKQRVMSQEIGAKWVKMYVASRCDQPSIDSLYSA